MKEYDVIHFEALGAEADHLREEMTKSIHDGHLPTGLRYLITPDNLQDYLGKHQELELPELITTKTHSVLPEAYVKSGRKSVITRSAGYDHFETLTGTQNITSLREYCIGSVAQTAIKLMYACCGFLNHYTMNTRVFERNHAISFMELDKNRTATVFGVGKIGKRIYELLEGNGLNVQAVDVREDELRIQYGDCVKFVSKEEAAANSDIVICAMNLTKDPKSRFYNVDYFSEIYLRSFRKDIMFINVTRGDIAPESVLLKLFREGKILGIGLDVFSDEEGFSKALRGEEAWKKEDHKAAKVLLEQSLDRSANIYVQPHQAFNSDIAAQSKAFNTVLHMESWYRNGGRGFDEQLPYYKEAAAEG